MGFPMGFPVFLRFSHGFPMFSKSPGMFHPASVSFPGHGAAVSSEVREPTGPEPSSGSNDM